MNVTSRDGTSIDSERTGKGPPVVLVTGGSVDRTSNAALAGGLSRGFTVLTTTAAGGAPARIRPPTRSSASTRTSPR